MTQGKLSNFYMELGARIKDARIKADLNQEVLAQQLNLTRASIVNIEKGRQRPMIHTLIEIAEILNTNLSLLLLGNLENVQIKKSRSPISKIKSFDNVVSDELILDNPTKNAVKKFFSHLKK